MYLICWRGVLLEEYFALAKMFLFFFFSKLHFPPVYYFNFNFSVTKIFSLVKENVFYVICYVR